MSSAGLRALLATLKEARHQRGDFRLAAVQDNVRQVLEMSGFTGIFQVFPTVEAAVTSFGG
jgi:anti-anti-sigma factor